MSVCLFFGMKECMSDASFPVSLPVICSVNLLCIYVCMLVILTNYISNCASRGNISVCLCVFGLFVFPSVGIFLYVCYFNSELVCSIFACMYIRVFCFLVSLFMLVC